MGYYSWPMMGSGWGLGFGIFGLIIWILIIIGIIYLIRALVKDNYQQTPPPKDSAMEILKERYAKGEINKQEFEEKMKDLMK